MTNGDLFGNKNNITDTNMMPEMLANADKLITENRRWNVADGGLDEDVDQYTKPNGDNTPFVHLNNTNNTNGDSKKENNKFGESGDNKLTDNKNSVNKNTDDESNWSQEELMLRKLDMLRQLTELVNAGVKLSQNYNLQSDYKTMKMEYELHKNIRAKHNAVQWMSTMMINIISGVEMLNEKYDPFSLKLKGWSESTNSNINSYYDVLGELYEKYNKPGKGMPPEIKLVLMVTAGAMQFHLTNSYMSNLSSLNSTLEQDPALADRLRQQAIANRKKQEEKLHESHNNVAKMVGQRTDNLNYLKEKELEKIKFEQMKAQEQLKLEEMRRNLANKPPVNNLSNRPQPSQMPPLPTNTNNTMSVLNNQTNNSNNQLNNQLNNQPTMQIPPQIIKMMENTEKQKAEVLKQQAELLNIQKKSIELDVKNKVINDLQMVKEMKQKNNNDLLSRSSKSSKASKISINKNMQDILTNAKNNKKKLDSEDDIKITPIEIVEADAVSKTTISAGKKSKKSNETNGSRLTVGSKKLKKNGLTINL